MNVADVCRAMEMIAPGTLARDWDNVGLLVGRYNRKVTSVLLCIDCGENVLAEAVRKKAEMIISYHPPLFRPISRVTESDAPVIYGAAAHDRAIYSPHTALDAAEGGTNDVLAEIVGLDDLRPLDPFPGTAAGKVVTFVPTEHAADVARAAFEAGAGIIGDYTHCSFMTEGVGTFRGGEESNPSVGRRGMHEAVDETRLEMVCPAEHLEAVRAAIVNAHDYEEPPVDIYPLRTAPGGIGMGRAGRLHRPLRQTTLINRIKKNLGLKKITVALSGGGERMVGTVAVAAGSCGGMWQSAIEAGAGFYLTGELKHHEARAATAAGMTVACVGHANSERPVLQRLKDAISRLLPGIQVILSTIDRDPYEIM